MCVCRRATGAVVIPFLVDGTNPVFRSESDDSRNRTSILTRGKHTHTHTFFPWMNQAVPLSLGLEGSKWPQRNTEQMQSYVKNCVDISSTVNINTESRRNDKHMQNSVTHELTFRNTRVRHPHMVLSRNANKRKTIKYRRRRVPVPGHFNEISRGVATWPASMGNSRADCSQLDVYIAICILDVCKNIPNEGGPFWSISAMAGTPSHNNQFLTNHASPNEDIKSTVDMTRDFVKEKHANRFNRATRCTKTEAGITHKRQE